MRKFAVQTLCRRMGVDLRCLYEVEGRQRTNLFPLKPVIVRYMSMDVQLDYLPYTQHRARSVLRRYPILSVFISHMIGMNRMHLYARYKRESHRKEGRWVNTAFGDVHSFDICLKCSTEQLITDLGMITLSLVRYIVLTVAA